MKTRLAAVAIPILARRIPGQEFPDGDLRVQKKVVVPKLLNERIGNHSAGGR